MSHIVKCRTEILDLTALAQAAEDCGMTLNLNKTSYASYYGMLPGCLHSISVNGGTTNGIVTSSRYNGRNYGDAANTYEVGVFAQDNGKPGFKLTYDSYDPGYYDGVKGPGNGLIKATGNALATLRQRYAVNVAKNIARRKGYRVSELKQKDGTVLVQCVEIGETPHVISVSANKKSESIVSIKGTQGPACKDLTKIFEDALGSEREDLLTPEYQEQPSEETVHAYQHR